jgi:hypothetical protein
MNSLIARHGISPGWLKITELLHELSRPAAQDMIHYRKIMIFFGTFAIWIDLSLIAGEGICNRQNTRLPKKRPAGYG